MENEAREERRAQFVLELDQKSGDFEEVGLAVESEDDIEMRTLLLKNSRRIWEGKRRRRSRVRDVDYARVELPLPFSFHLLRGKEHDKAENIHKLVKIVHHHHQHTSSSSPPKITKLPPSSGRSFPSLDSFSAVVLHVLTRDSFAHIQSKS